MAGKQKSRTVVETEEKAVGVTVDSTEIPLRGRRKTQLVEVRADYWHDALEQVVQYSIRELNDLRANNFYGGLHYLESTIYTKCLDKVRKEQERKHVQSPPQLSLFTEMIGLVSLRQSRRGV